MRLDDHRESSNIEDQRGSGGGFRFPMGGGGGLPLGGGRMGCGMLAIIVVGALILGINPLQLLGLAGGGLPVPQGQEQPQGTPAGPATNATDRFVSQVLATTEDTWGAIFKAEGRQYPPPRLVFYSGTGQSGCGVAQSAVGPFYCPADRKIYLDTSFFDELARRFGAPGDFAQAYVIAHEVGHHIQTITGTSDQVRQAQARASKTEANAIQVRMELQADCYAGVWGAHNRQYLEAGDVEEAMRAAEAIGDDALQKQAQGYVVPDSFTHGSSAQRMAWFKRGMDSGDPASCDTFAARSL